MVKEINPIIFIWIGDQFPSWAILSLEKCCINNKKRRVILLHDKYLNKEKILKKRRLNNLEFKNIKIDDNTFFNKSNKRFEDKFWLNTSLRIEVLFSYVSENKISCFFHAELDNVLFNLDNLDNKFNAYGSGIFMPRDSVDRAIGSILYCNRIKSLLEILSFYKEPFNAKNDMNAFGLYAKTSKNFFSLPTESYKENLNFFKILNPDYTNGIFDAASIGQYLFGLDPKISKYKPTRNLFINENAKIDFIDFEIFIYNFRLWVKTQKYSKKYKLYNLHVHCKDFKLAEELLEKKAIFNSLKKKKRVLISGRYKIIFGRIHMIFDNLKSKIKKTIFLVK